MLGATLARDSGAAMVHAYHPDCDKSTTCVIGCEGTFVRAPLAHVNHDAPWPGSYHWAPWCFCQPGIGAPAPCRRRRSLLASRAERCKEVSDGRREQVASKGSSR